MENSRSEARGWGTDSVSHGLLCTSVHHIRQTFCQQKNPTGSNTRHHSVIRLLPIRLPLRCSLAGAESAGWPAPCRPPICARFEQSAPEEAGLTAKLLELYVDLGPSLRHRPKWDPTMTRDSSHDSVSSTVETECFTKSFEDFLGRKY